LTRKGIRAAKLGYAPMNIERTKAIELKAKKTKVVEPRKLQMNKITK
jgi:hypothetical protein